MRLHRAAALGISSGVLLLLGLACASTGGTFSEAEDEAHALCLARVDLAPHEERARQRRRDQQIFQVSSGGMRPDELADRMNRDQFDDERDCLAQVVPALAGPEGVEATRILRSARTSCETGDVPESELGFVPCIHARKLALFRERHPEDDAAARATLDRLLQVGRGAPLSDAERAAYCDARELRGTRHPVCD